MVSLLRPEMIPYGHGLAIYANVQVRSFSWIAMILNSVWQLAQAPITDYTFVGSVSPLYPTASIAVNAAINRGWF